MRDYRRIPLRKLRKRELRALVVDMRLRHEDEISELLGALPAEQALRLSFARARKAMGSAA